MACFFEGAMMYLAKPRIRKDWFKGHRSAIGFAYALFAGAAAIVPLFEDAFPRTEFAVITFVLVVVAGLLQAVEFDHGSK